MTLCDPNLAPMADESPDLLIRETPQGVLSMNESFVLQPEI